MAFKIPSMSEARSFLLALGKALFPDRNYGNLRSYHAKRATFVAGAQAQLHAHVAAATDDAMPDTASDGEPLLRHGRIRKVARKGATSAHKAAAGRVIGTPGTPVPVDRELIYQSGNLQFRVMTGTVVPAGGSVDVDIIATSTGSATRLLAGTVLKFVSTPAGLETNVVLVRDLDEDGFDDEPYGAYRQRILDRWGSATAGGNQSDYVAWSLLIEGISAAYAYRQRAGIGTVDVVAFHQADGAARSLTSGERAELLAHLIALAPMQLSGGALRVLETVADSQAVELAITTNGETGYAFDWTGGPLTVLTWTAVTRSLQFTTDIPSSMDAGDRITLKGVGSAQDGREYKIEAISAADTIILEAAPAVDPVATDLVYSGGPLVTPIRDAIVGHLNGQRVYAGRNRIPYAESALASTVRLEVIAEGVGPANPGGIYGTWSGGIIRSVIAQIALYKAGVRNVDVTVPAADYEAEDDAFPNDDQIHFIAPASVLVRSI